LDAFRSGNAFQDGFDHRRSFAELTGAFISRLGDVSAEARAGLHSDAGKTFTSASVALWSEWFRVQGSTTGQRWNWMDRAGFGSLSQPAADLPAGRLTRASAQVDARWGWLGASVTLFYHRESDVPLWRVDRDTEEAKEEFLPGQTTVLGAAPELSLRSSEELGIYGFVRPTFVRRTTGVASGVGDALRTSSPEFWMNGRLGVHALLFQHDLDLDLSARTLYWASMNGRRLDVRTGLVMLPMNDATSVPSSWTFDIVAEAGVRGATIFLAYENLFSGTNVVIGNLLIPDYPLPAQRFRFGVFWPISN
jgi:hypothetical protein